MNSIKTIFGIFEDRRDVESAIGQLRQERYKPEEMSIVMKDMRERQDIADKTGADVIGNTVAGATTGGVLGGLAGLLASAVIPGLGAFFIGGPLATALGLTGITASAVSGAAAGVVAGGLIGVLTGFGMSEDDAREYEELVRQGTILLAVPARAGEEEIVVGILDDNNAMQVKTIAMPTETEADYSERSLSYAQPAYATIGAKGGRSKSGKTSKKKRTTQRI